MFTLSFCLRINVQFIKNEKIVLRSLVMVELLDRQTREFLRSMIMSALKKFDFLPEQIYSVTSDNGANMVKAIRLIIDEEEKRMEDPYDIDDTINQVIANVELGEHLETYAYKAIKICNSLMCGFSLKDHWSNWFWNLQTNHR
jgi:hypothetical protein